MIKIQVFSCFCAVTCTEISLPNGEVNYTTTEENGRYMLNTVATFVCDSESNLSGFNSSTCQASNNSAYWNPETPTFNLSNESMYHIRKYLVLF